MTIWMGLALLGMGAAERQLTIEPFAYTSANEVRQQWRAFPGGDEPLLAVAPDEDRQVTQLSAPFAAEPSWERVYIDRAIQLDLSAAGGFELELKTDSPAAAARLSLYFRSGQGWYAAGTALSAGGWQTLPFSKASFSIEDRPSGWHRIDGIRIAVWRGKARDHAIQLRDLRTVQNDVAIVVPSATQIDSRAASQTAELVAGMLEELGLGSDAIEESSLAAGALGKRRVAILAHTPRLSSEAEAALIRFVEDGGKVFVCYQLRPRLGAALGFTPGVYLRQQREGQFAEVRFQEATIPELPEVMRQASWNITTAEPAGFHARVVGRWYQADGTSTDQPALLVSDRGAYFSHILLSDDRPAKQRMLAAILGHLAPELWHQMAAAALDRCGRVGHLRDLDKTMEYLASHENTEGTKVPLWLAHIALAEARKSMRAKAFPQVVHQAAQAHDRLVTAYLMAQPSLAREGRACWNHTGTGAYPGDWNRTARELEQAGFNMVLPNMLWGGRAHYASDVLPRSRTFRQYGDQIEQCVAACRKHALEVHVWKVNWNLSGAPAEFVNKIRHENRHQVDVNGTAHDWLCPSHPANQQLELESMLEVARKYQVNGLHFDYIRYPDRTKCYCDGCRQRFEEYRDERVKNWPTECYSGDLREEYTQWRCDQITNLVRAVHDQAKKLRPGLKISAAVFGEYPSCRDSVAQDWPAWIKAGYLDFVCPMDYTQSDPHFVELARSQLELVGDRIPVYPGIGQWRLPEDRTVGQIHLARQLGADGFTIFDLTPESVRTAVPAIGLGVGKERAVPPHE